MSSNSRGAIRRISHASRHLGAGFGRLFGPRPSPLVNVGSRRWFLQVGLTGVAGVSLPGLFQTRSAAAPQGRSRQSSPHEHWINPAGRPVPLVETGQPIAELL